MALPVSLLALSLVIAGCDTGSGGGGGDTPAPSQGSGPGSNQTPVQTQYALDWGVFQGDFETVFNNVKAAGVIGVGDSSEYKVSGTTIGYLVEGAKATQAFNWTQSQNYEFEDGVKNKTGTFSELMNYQYQGQGMPQAMKSTIKESNLPVAGIMDGGTGYAVIFYIRNPSLTPVQAQYTLDVGIFQDNYASLLATMKSLGFQPDQEQTGANGWVLVKGAAKTKQVVDGFTSQNISYEQGSVQNHKGTFSELLKYEIDGKGLPSGIKNSIKETDLPVAGMFDAGNNYVSIFYVRP